MSQKKFLDKIGLQNFLNRIKALIPTKTSELQNDSGFITSEGAYDSALSLESEKAVQNKVVTAAINGKQDTLSTAQTNAVNSGITSAKVQGYDSHISDTEIHVTQADKTSWDSKAPGTHTHLASEVSGLSTVATSGSYNDLSNKPSIPSKTSDLTNDSGFLTSHNPVDSALSSTSTNAVQNKVINNALTGKSDTGHTHLASEVSGLSTVATSGSYNDLTNKPTIDSALSSTSTNAVQNKVINTELGKKANTTDLATVATSGSYADLSNKPSIPSKTSDLTNDSGFLTSHNPVDSALSSTSTNAVQNKVINTELGKKANTTDLATVATSGSYNDLSNKPTIPTVNNATLTIQKNGTTVKTFTANSSTNVTADITVPTKVSELTNDSGFLTSHNPVDSALSTTSENAVQNKVVKAELDNKANSADLSTVATTGSYTDLNNIPSNFTPASHTHGSITNDGKLGTASRALITDGNKKIAVSSVTSTELGYLSGVTSAVQDQLDGKAASTHSHTASEVSGLATVATSGSYNDLANKPTIPTVNNATLTIQKNGTTVKTFTANASANVTANITVPTKVSELTNDSGFLTSHNPVDSALSDTSTNAVQNKAVKGALDGKSDTGHTHTASEVSGLSTVATSGSYNDLSNKPTIPTVNNATLTIQKNGTTVKTFTANASSNVTANITVPTKVSELTNDSGFLTSASSLDSSKLTGTIDIARLPKGALERLVTVADQTARFALTTSDVQLGDTVKQLDTGVMYIVTDESKLSSVDGYTEYTAGAATSVPWSGVTGKPSSYTPASHSHGNIANGGTLGTASRALITDGNKKITTSSVTSTELGYLSGVTSAVQTQLNGKAASSHTHTASEVSGLSTVATSGSYNDLSNKPTIDSALSSTSTNAVQNKVINTALAGKAASSHTHTKSQITDFPTKTSQFTNDSHQTITVGTDTTSTASPAHSGTFTCIDSVTRDSNGHVTAVNTKTVTLPADNNTDTKVTNTLGTTTKAYVTGTTSATTNTGTQVFDTGVYLSTTAGELVAAKFTGALNGNANTATQFSANKAVTLTGDVTGTASSKAGWSVATTLSDSGVTAGTYGPSADVTGNNNATISVPEITVDSKGRVTSVANRTLTCKNNTYNVYNKTLTIQKNGTNVATFTSNSNTDVTANITVPTKTSELTNDSGFLTSHQSLSNYVTLNGAQTITGVKTFTAEPVISKGYPAFIIKNTSTETTVYPSSGNIDTRMNYTDKNGHNLGSVLHRTDTNKSAMCLRAFNFNRTDSENSWADIAIGYDNSGNAYTYAPTPTNLDNTTKIATTAFVYNNAAKHFYAATNIYVAKAATGNGSGSNTSNYMSLADLRTFLATAHTHSSASDLNGSYNLQLLFKAGDSFGNATFDAAKMPGVRNLILNTSTGTNSTTDNYSTNSPTFGNITVTGDISVTMRNLNCTGRISSQYGAYVAIDTYMGISSLQATNNGYLNVAKNMVINVCDAHTDYLFSAANNGILSMWPGATVTINFRQQCYYTRCLFLSSSNGTAWIGYSSFKLTGTEPMAVWGGSGTLTGTSETAAATAEKAVTLASGQTFTLTKNATAKVKFTIDNTAANPTLNIGGTGAKPIYWNNAAVPAAMLMKNITYDVKYNGSQFVIQNVVKRLTNNDFGVFRSTGNYNQTYNSGSWNFTGWNVAYGTGIENSNWRGSHIGNIQQNVTSNNNTFPILFSGTANATANTSTAPYFGTGVKVNPSTSIISANGFSGAPETNYVQGVKDGGALVNSQTTSFGAVWRAPTKNYQVAGATFPSNTDTVYICYSVTNANVSAGTNTVAKQLTWAADTGTLTANAFSGALTGNVTGNCSGSSGSCTGLAAKATGNANGKELTNTIIKGLSISGKTITYTQIDGTTGTLTTQDNNTWTAMVGATSSANGSVGYVNAVPPKDGYNTKYLRADGTWAVPPDHTYTVNNATLTIQKNGTNVATFTSNASSNATANITVPTKTSELTNDSGFLTSHQSLSNYVTLNGAQTISATKTWTSSQSFKNTAITNHKANPSADTAIWWQFWSNDNKYWGGIGHNYLTTGVSEVQIAMSNWTTSGSQGYWHLDFGATKDFSSVYFRPSGNNNVYLGTSDKKWANVYATTFTGNLTGNVTGNVSGSSGSCTGNAATATQFSANKSVTLTGDVTGTASSKAGWSVATTLANSGVTAGTYGPSADVTGNNNATISVPEITVDAKGRVTSVVNRTLTCKNNTYTVNNATLTIQKNGTNVATFTSNASANATANITVPTKTSQLTNDSGYLTSHQDLSLYPYKVASFSNYGNGRWQAIDLGNTTTHPNGFNEIVATGKYQVRWTNATTVGVPFTTSAETDGILEVDGISAASGVSSYQRVVQRIYRCSTAHIVYFRYGAYHDGTWNWSDWTSYGDIVTHNASEFLTSHQSLSNYVTLNGDQTISGAKTFTGDVIGINKDNSTENANDLYSTTAGSKLTYYTTTNGGTKLTNVPAAVNTTLESRTIRRLSASDWVVDQICHNIYGLYYRQGSNGTWGAWKTFAFTDSNISGNAATATKATGNANGKELTNTIIKGLSISGKTITYTQIDGSTGTLTTQDTNTDTLMTQNVSTTNATYPILLVATADATANQGAKTGIFAKSVKVNPSTNVISASGFSGPLTGNVTGNCSGSSGSCTGNAATATQFSATTTVALTGDATGTSAGSKKGWSVPVTLANSGVTAGTYGPSADVTGNNNATISVPQITVDAKGRVTSVTNRTLTCKNNTYNVYNKTLTIQKNGTNVATFTSNSNTDVTANITVPTKVSELTNDSGYLTSHQSLSNYVTLNGTQTISGTKTFSAIQYFNEYKLVVKATNQTVGTKPSSNKWNGMVFQDTAGTSTFTIENGHMKNGSTQLNLGCTPNISGAAKETFLQYHCGTTEGASALNILTASATAPTPATSDNSTKIATTAFVKAQGYITSSGTSANVSGTVAIANGGTGATSRLNAVKNLTNENVGTNTLYFLTISNNWGKAGYCSIADARTVLEIPTFAFQKFAWEENINLSTMASSSEWEKITGGYKYTANVSLKAGQLTWIYVYLTTSNDLIKIVITNGYILSGKNCVDGGKNSIKADTTTYGNVLTQTVCGASRLNCLFYPYNSTVTLTMTYTILAHAGGENPTLSGKVLIKQ